MDPNVLKLLGKTVGLMENMGFLWLVYSGFELQLWEQLQKEITIDRLLADNPDWDAVLLEHWLSQAVIQNLLILDKGTYRLSSLGKSVLRYQDFGLEAMYKEFVVYWSVCFRQLPDFITGQKERPSLENELKDELISRASRSSEIFVWPVLRKKCRKDNWQKILDIGCGEGIYLKKLLTVFPELTGVGLEINSAACMRAKQGMEKYQDRVRIVCRDVFDFKDTETFDCCLLNNTIYYFTGTKRLELLRHIRTLLKSGGQIGILTALRETTSSVPILPTHIPQNLMSFFLSCHQGFDGLPTEQDIIKLLQETGFEKIEVTPLLFKVSHYFFATKI